MKRLSASRRVALVGLFAAATLALSALESALPPLPVPGARMGLSNVPLMAAMAFLGPLCGTPIVFIKVVFVLLTRGLTAALLSCCGTVAAFAVTVAVLPLVQSDKAPLTFVGAGVLAATAHTLGQLLCAAILLTPVVWAMSPLLLIVCLPTGIITGWVLNVLMVPLEKLSERM